MHDLPTKITASAIVSELQSSDIHMTIKARLFDLKANLNGVRVTEGFLDEIIKNESKYQCIGLYADLRGLLANRTIGHMYNRRTGEFGSTMIGSFYHYEKEVDGDNAYLVGYARLPKRNKAVCKAISELFADGNLKFSFEITCGEYTKLSDGTMVIDTSDANYFEGEAIVTFPACEDAVALELVAECLGKGDENMANDKTNKNDEDVVQAENKEVAETETADRVYIHEHHVEQHAVNAFNCDTGEEVSQSVTVETHTSTPIDTDDTVSNALAYAEKNDEAVAEKKNEDVPVADDAEQTGPSTEAQGDHGSGDEPESTTDNTAETASCKDQKTGESDEQKDETPAPEDETENHEDQQNEKQTASAYAGLFENIMAELKSIKAELATLKEAQSEKTVAKRDESVQADASVIAEVQRDANKTMNPFMASMTAPSNRKYSLLEKEEKKATRYTLLDRV